MQQQLQQALESLESPESGTPRDRRFRPTAEAPFLSVVIPTYNRAGRLMRTLEGLVAQTLPFDEFEVIVVSDGSTDGTDDLLTVAEERLPFHLKAIRQENAGPSRARNRGVAEARGDVVVFLDDDVEPAPDCLAAHAAHHREDPAAVVIGPMVPDPAFARQEPVWIAWEHAMLERQYRSWRTGVWKSAGPNHFYSGNASLRREHLLAIGGFDESFTRQEDVELAYRLERERQVDFRYEQAALGIHRPVRSFESWLRVPHAYGRCDIVRARRADPDGAQPLVQGRDWDCVRHAYVSRSLTTRIAACVALAAPPVSRPLRGALRRLAGASYRLRARRLAFAALSTVYNVHYLEGASQELGSGRRLLHLVRSLRPPAAPPPAIRSAAAAAETATSGIRFGPSQEGGAMS